MPVPQIVNFLVEQASCLFSENGARCEFEPRLIVAQFKIIKKTGFKSVTPRLMTKNFKGGTSPRIYPWNQSQIENPQAPAFIRGVNLKSQISNLKSIDPDPKFLGQLSWQASNFHSPVSLSFCGVGFDAAGKVKSNYRTA